MKAIKDFCGNWNPDKWAIQFKWDVSDIGNDRYIYIVALQEVDGSLGVDLSKSLVFDICDMRNTSQSSTFMQISNLRVGVYKMMFCAYSTPTATNYTEEEIIKACQSDPKYTTTVVMGRASISYVSQCTVVDNSKIVKIHLKSDSDISEGVLGYRYCVDNCEIITPFPKGIAKGKTSYNPFLIPKNCEIQIVPIDKRFLGNLEITAKKSKFLL